MENGSYRVVYCKSDSLFEPFSESNVILKTQEPIANSKWF